MKEYYVLPTVYFFILTFLLSACNKNDNQKESTFKDYSCTSDCSGHKAGYVWAAKKGINSPDDCGGKSSSFIEGCKAYAVDQ